MTDLDRSFRRFRRTGDPAALARVFDRTAPELLRIAMHLLRDSAAAEDAVQETFLTVIEDAASFDDTRPFAPWVAGILANRCRRLRGRGRAALRTEELREAAIADPAPDPAAAADASDLSTRLDAALAGVPEPYRAALELRLQHELGATAIAARLGRRASTVRTQLQRGLEHLRRGLPRGLAPALVYVPARGLDDVRRTVVARAETGAATAAVGVGALRLAAVIAAVLVTAAGVLRMARGGSSDRGTDRPRLAAGSAAPDVEEEMPGARGADRLPARRDPAPSSVVNAAAATITGVVVAAETGQPLAGCAVRLSASIDPDDAVRDPAVLEPGPPVVTGPDGRFVVTVVPTAVHGLALELRSSGRPPVRVGWKAPAQQPLLDFAATIRPGERRDLGDVPIPRGHEVVGQVVDPSGRPLAGVRLRLDPTVARVVGTARVYASSNARSDAGGKLEFSGPVSEGSWRLSLDDAAHEAVDVPAEVRIGSGGAVAELRAVVRARASVTGDLVDEIGRPLSGIRLVARTPDGDVIARATTGRDGEFRMFASRPDAGGVHIRPAGAGVIESLWEDHAFGWGTRDLRLIARVGRERSARLALRVVESGTARPIEEFVYRCGVDPARFDAGRPSPPIRSAGSIVAPGGLVEITGVRAGPRAILVDTRRERYQSSGSIPFVMGETDTALTAELVPSDPIRVRVRGIGGRPAVGAWVELVGVGDGPFDAQTPVARAHACRAGTRPVRFDARFTDAAGRATVHAPRGSRGLALRVRSADGRTSVVSDPRGGIDVSLDVGGAIVGRILSDDLMAMRPEIAVRPSGPAVGAEGMRTARIDPDGRFELRGLPPGVWDVRLIVAVDGPGGFVRPAQLDPVLASVAVEASREIVVVLDEAAVRPGVVRGRVLLDGQPPPAGSRVSLRALAPGIGGALAGLPIARWVCGDASVAGDGSFALDRIPPSSYRVDLRCADPETGTILARTSEVTFVLDPGAVVERVFEIDGSALRLRVLAPDDAPLADAHVVVLAADSPLPRFAATDGAGIIVLAPAPQGPVRVRSVDGQLESEPVQPSGQGPVEVRLRAKTDRR